MHLDILGCLASLCVCPLYIHIHTCSLLYCFVTGWHGLFYPLFMVLAWQGRASFFVFYLLVFFGRSTLPMRIAQASVLGIHIEAFDIIMFSLFMLS